MKVIFKRCDSIVENDFFKALFSEIYRLNPQENANNAYRLFRNRLATVKELYDTDVSKMNDVDYGMFLNLNYYIELSNDDYIAIYNKTNNKDYCHYPNLNTNLVTEVPLITSNEGLHSSWVLTPAKISYEVFLDKSVAFNPNKEYSLKELEEMINNKDLIIVNVLYQKTDDKSLDEQEVTRADSTIFPVYPLKKSSERHSDYYKEYIKKMHTIVTNKRILEDLRKYLLDYKQTLDYFLTNMPYIKVQQEITKAASDRIDNSDEYGELEDLIEKLNTDEKTR